MNCEKAKKNISLLAGGELPARKARRLREHLEKCEACQKELEEYQAALAGLKAVASEEGQDWEESDWKSLMKKVMAEKAAPRALPFRPSQRLAAWKPKFVWAYAFLLLLIVGSASVLLRSVLRRPAAPRLVAESVTLTQTEPSRTFGPEKPILGQIKDKPFAVKTKRDKTQRVEPILRADLSRAKATQNLLSITLVSQETGLKVYWTFNKDFEWKELER